MLGLCRLRPGAACAPNLPRAVLVLDRFDEADQGRWRIYQNHLQPLIGALVDAAVAIRAPS
jgi:hypothetical protein